MLNRPIRALLCGSLFFVASVDVAIASPKLSIDPYQEAKRPKGVTGIPVWEPVWWARLEGTADSAPIARIEYRGAFKQGPKRNVSGGWDIDPADGQKVQGRVRVVCAQLSDYDDPVEVRFRLVDVNGDTSDWITAKFPPPVEVAEEDAEPIPVPTVLGKPMGTVSYVATDDTTMSGVRTELERLARIQGGAGISEVRSERLEDGRFKFTATVLAKGEPPTPSTKAPAVATGPAARPRSKDRILGEVRFRLRQR